MASSGHPVDGSAQVVDSTVSHKAGVAPLSLQGSSPITLRPVFGLVRNGEVGVDKKHVAFLKGKQMSSAPHPF